MKSTTQIPLVMAIVIAIGGVAHSQVSPYSELQVTAPEVWTIDGQETRIYGTVVTGSALFTVHAEVGYPPSMDADSGLAADIARFAIENGYLANAIRLNYYSEAIYVRDDVVGVALIYREPSSDLYSGVRFAFVMNELYSESRAMIAAAPEPRGFGEKQREQLRTDLNTIFSAREYHRLVDLFSVEARLQHAQEDVRTALEFFRLAESIRIVAEGFVVFRGAESGRRSFQYFIPAEIVPAKSPNTVLAEHVVVQIMDAPGQQFSVMQVDLNFATQEAMDQMQ